MKCYSVNSAGFTEKPTDLLQYLNEFATDRHQQSRIRKPEGMKCLIFLPTHIYVHTHTYIYIYTHTYFGPSLVNRELLRFLQ
jgi:hypothetical protein